MVPLIEHLTNGQFDQTVQTLMKAAAEESDSHPRLLCRCGCRREVPKERKFVNQDHYNTWLSRERFFGRNKRCS